MPRGRELEAKVINIQICSPTSKLGRVGEIVGVDERTARREVRAGRARFLQAPSVGYGPPEVK
jgi:hypothetical protein